MNDAKRIRIAGTAVAVRGNDVDTDRIMPARFLKCITFEGLGAHVFEDDRRLLGKAGQTHPFDDPQRQNAQVLLVNKNFGCGSSREHAPRGLRSWNRGIGVIVGESFAEIFFSNATACGVPCPTAGEADVQKAFDACLADPQLVFTVDLESMTLSFGGQSIPLFMPEGPRKQMLEGCWDATLELLEGEAEIRRKAESLRYFRNWAR